MQTQRKNQLHITTKARSIGVLKTLVLLLLFYLAGRYLECDPLRFLKRSSHLSDIVTAMFPPDWSFTGTVLPALYATFQMSVTGTAFGAFLALFAAPMCAANLGHHPILRLLIQILRAIPALITALLMTFFFGLGVFSGAVAITIYTFAIMTKLTCEDIEHTPLGVYHALRSMGAGFFVACRRGLLPGILSSFLANVLYLLETNVRQSAILGYVGAGGLGILLNEKVAWREYDKVGTMVVLLFLTVVVIEILSTLIVKVLRNEIRMKQPQKRVLYAAAAALFLLCTLTLPGPDFSHSSLKTAVNIVLGLMHPDWGFFFQPGADGLAGLLLETVAIAFVGTGTAAAAALLLSFLGSARFAPLPIAMCVRILVISIRTIPFIIYSLIFIRVTGPGAFAGVLTIMICSIGLITKRFTEAIDRLDLKAFHALRNAGVGSVTAISRAILPQLKPAFAAAVIYRFDVNIREASILGVVGAGGIGAPLIFAMNKFSWNTAGAILLGLIILVCGIDRLSARKKKNKK